MPSPAGSSSSSWPSLRRGVHSQADLCACCCMTAAPLLAPSPSSLPLDRRCSPDPLVNPRHRNRPKAPRGRQDSRGLSEAPRIPEACPAFIASHPCQRVDPLTRQIALRGSGRWILLTERLARSEDKVLLQGLKSLYCGWQADLDTVLESIQAPRFIDFSEMAGKEPQADEVWRQSMGRVTAPWTPSAKSPQNISPSDLADDDDFRLSPPRTLRPFS